MRIWYLPSRYGIWQRFFRDDHRSHVNFRHIIGSTANVYFSSAHLSVALRSVSFGNLVHAGKFISHFTRYADCDGVDSRKWLSALRNEKVAHAMFVDFEHDRNLLVVRFAVHDGEYHFA